QAGVLELRVEGLPACVMVGPLLGRGTAVDGLVHQEHVLGHRASSSPIRRAARDLIFDDAARSADSTSGTNSPQTTTPRAAQAALRSSNGPPPSSRRHASRTASCRSASRARSAPPAGPTPKVNGSHHSSNDAYATRVSSTAPSTPPSPAESKSRSR